MTGGGCSLVDEGNMPCDNDYECECGAKFKAYSSAKVHFEMPHFVAGKNPPEPIEINNQ